MSNRILPRLAVGLLCLAAASLAACSYSVPLLSDAPSRHYRLTENAKVFWDTLLVLPRELAVTPQFPIGTPVKVIKIKRYYDFPEEPEEWALVQVGEGAKAVRLRIYWPARYLEEVSAR